MFSQAYQTGVPIVLLNIQSKVLFLFLNRKRFVQQVEFLGVVEEGVRQELQRVHVYLGKQLEGFHSRRQQEQLPLPRSALLAPAAHGH